MSINNILSRDMSFGQSSHVYYQSTSNVGVPFQWEMKPRTPMNPPLEEVILQPPPPPPPPSAVQSLVLHRPNVVTKDSSLSWKFWLWWRRLRKNMRLQMYDRGGYCGRFSGNGKGNKVSSSNGDMDDELVGWIHGDSKSSSSSTNGSSSVCLSNEQFDSFRKGVPFSCTTWRKYKSNN